MKLNLTRAIFLGLLIFSSLGYAYIKVSSSDLSDPSDVVDIIITFSGFALTALGLYFVVLQISALAEQVSLQREQHHRDSEFKNFLEATKLLISTKENNTAQISAMYLLFDFAKKYPENLEKVIKVLTRYVLPFYEKILIMEKRNINEWKEKGEDGEQICAIALELIKKLFIFALQENNSRHINLSGVVIFDLDTEVDTDLYTNLKLSNLIKKSDRMTFLHCNFSNSLPGKKDNSIDFSTQKNSIIEGSVRGRLNISISSFLNCNLANCNFSYSNLWAVSFEKCNLSGAKFNQAECEGGEFSNTDISPEQLDSMLFLGKNDFSKFSSKYNRPEQLRYAVIYSKLSSCFVDQPEYEKFKNSFAKE